MGYENSRDREVRLSRGHCNSVKFAFLAFDERAREIMNLFDIFEYNVKCLHDALVCNQFPILKLQMFL
jgi:hypothetical protein